MYTTACRGPGFGIQIPPENKLQFHLFDTRPMFRQTTANTAVHDAWLNRALVAIGALALSGVVALSYGEWRRYRRANARAARSSDIVDAADALLTSLLDAETAQRGYLFTGIQPEDMGRMFDALSTTTPDSMGMGLHISPSIIDAHGGRSWAEANHDAGLTMQFTLPVAAIGQKATVGGAS